MPFFERSKITVQQRHLFKNIFSYGRFRYAFTLRKKVFSAAPVKWFFLYGSNNSDSVVFGEYRFWNYQRSKFENNTFSKKKKKKKKKKKNAMEVLGMCLPYLKRYFQEHQWSVFFFVAQITQILLFFGMPVERQL